MKVSMEVNQIKLLSSLAKKLESEKKDRAQIVASLQSAKILTKKGGLLRLPGQF